VGDDAKVSNASAVSHKETDGGIWEGLTMKIHEVQALIILRFFVDLIIGRADRTRQ